MALDCTASNVPGMSPLPLGPCLFVPAATLIAPFQAERARLVIACDPVARATPDRGVTGCLHTEPASRPKLVVLLFKLTSFTDKRDGLSSN